MPERGSRWVLESEAGYAPASVSAYEVESTSEISASEVQVVREGAAFADGMRLLDRQGQELVLL